MLLSVPSHGTPLTPLSLLPNLSSLTLTPTLPRRTRKPNLIIRMGGGPRTFPGGVSKWQWKRMQAKKAKQLLKARLARERQMYEMRKRAELKAAVAELERPWEVLDEQSERRKSMLFSVNADEQLKVLADRFQKPGGFDLWTEDDGPEMFLSPHDGLVSSRFFPKGVVHSVKPYGRIGGGEVKGLLANDVGLSGDEEDLEGHSLIIPRSRNRSRKGGFGGRGGVNGSLNERGVSERRELGGGEVWGRDDEGRGMMDDEGSGFGEGDGFERLMSAARSEGLRGQGNGRNLRGGYRSGRGVGGGNVRQGGSNGGSSYLSGSRRGYGSGNGRGRGFGGNQRGGGGRTDGNRKEFRPREENDGLEGSTSNYSMRGGGGRWSSRNGGLEASNSSYSMSDGGKWSSRNGGLEGSNSNHSMKRGSGGSSSRGRDFGKLRRSNSEDVYEMSLQHDGSYSINANDDMLK